MKKIKQRINTVLLRIRNWGNALKEHIVEKKWYYIISFLTIFATIIASIIVSRYSINITEMDVSHYFNKEDLGWIIIVFITVFIPIGIVIFNQTANNPLLRSIVLHNVLHIKRLACAVLLTISSVLLWEHFSFLAFLLYLIGIVLISKTFLNCYHWIESKRKPNYMLEYLGNLKDLEDIQRHWGFIWGTEDRSFIYEIRKQEYEEETPIFKVFAKKIDELFERAKDNDSDAYKVHKIISHFARHLDKRPLYDIQWSERVLSKILEWNFEREKRRKERMYWGDYAIEQCFQRIVFLTLQNENRVGGNGMPLYTFFKSFNEHLKEHQQDREYIKHLMLIFYREFFQGIERQSDKGSYVWNEFPEEWMVTAKSWKDKDNIASGVACREFIEWMRHKVNNQDNKGHDAVLERASSSLFPETDPIIWSLILECRVFILPNEHREASIRTMIERPSIFGMVGRVFSSWGGDEQGDYHKSMEEQRVKTFELAWLLFGGLFSKKNLEEYIKILKSMEGEYDEKTREDDKRRMFLSLFEEMLKAEKGSVVG